KPPVRCGRLNSKHGGDGHALIAPHARTRAASRLGVERHSPVLFTCQTAHISSLPRRVFCAWVLLLASRTRNEGWRSAEITCGCCGTRGARLAARPGRV